MAIEPSDSQFAGNMPTREHGTQIAGDIIVDIYRWKHHQFRLRLTQPS